MIHRFFIGNEIGEQTEILLPKEIDRQISGVLRMKSGERITVFDGSGNDFISEYSGKGKAKVLEKIPNRRDPERKIYLFPSLLKKDKMEWVFQKGTELGVYEFCPVLSERSVKKDFNLERAQKIIKEAAEQCGRAFVPAINSSMDFSEALEFVQEKRFRGLIADVNSKRHIFESLKEPHMALFIGPEGGWTEKELAEAKEYGFQNISLGKLNLRAETASIVGSAFLVS
ncbi:16S rRNA (uracil(1498)-N(3))-methyltransferase [Candidatus Giovannonibacteria bacterium]|nr:16S rRNA (uracil(1498)-N(3))-methyltransferase [Candidatus Giovannonibacteria bacterium]